MQHCFLSGRSTLTNLLENNLDWTSGPDARNNIDVVHLDLSKAFNSVVHVKFIAKLSSYSFSDNLLHWFTCFLSNRIQCTNIEGIHYEYVPVVSGVPPRQCIGPTIIFIIYQQFARVSAGKGFL